MGVTELHANREIMLKLAEDCNIELDEKMIRFISICMTEAKLQQTEYINKIIGN